MKLSTLGEVAIELTPASTPEVMNVKLGCEMRKEVLIAQTRPDETVDQFCQRLRGMLRALVQSEIRITPEKAPAKTKDKTWNQLRAEIKHGPSIDPVPQQPPSQP